MKAIRKTSLEFFSLLVESQGNLNSLDYRVHVIDEVNFDGIYDYPIELGNTIFEKNVYCGETIFNEYFFCKKATFETGRMYSPAFFIDKI